MAAISCRRGLLILYLIVTITAVTALPGRVRPQQQSDKVDTVEPQPVKIDSVFGKKNVEVKDVDDTKPVKYVTAGSSFAPIVVVFDNLEEHEVKSSKERVVVSDPKTVTGGSVAGKQVSEGNYRVPAPVIEMQDEGDLLPERGRHHDGDHDHASSMNSSSSTSTTDANAESSGITLAPAESRSKVSKPAEFYNVRKNHAARPQLPPHKTAAMRDFIAQNDLFNSTFPCSFQEKSCLEEERVLYEADKSCYLLWRKGPCERGEWLVIDKKEATRGTGHFRAVCAPMRPCSDRKVLMAFDQQCHSLSQIIREVCPKHEGLQLSYNVFGEGECKCDNCPAPQLPSNTFNEGRCAFPPSFYRSAVPEPEGLADEMARMEAEEEEAAAAEADVVAVPEAKTKTDVKKDAPA